MSDYPVIFSAPMVRALLDGRKTMTRRLAWKEFKPDIAGDFLSRGYRLEGDKFYRPSPWQKVRAGDRLWVRENFQLLRFGDYAPTTERPCDIRYAATDPLADCGKDVRGYPWRPCIHMPSWASRLTLVVTATKIERLQEISADDAEAEGIEIGGPDVAVYRDNTLKYPEAARRYDVYRVNQFARLWMSIHGEDAWAANPEVVALIFTVHKANIDQMKDPA